MQFFYDKQIRRYLVQIIRVFSNFTVKYADGTLHQIPVMYGDADRQAAVIMRQNSENVVQSVPRMAVYITDLSMDRSRLGDSSYVGKIHIRERDIDNTDPVNPTYTGAQGKNFTVERLMPTPFKLTVKVDIWSANTEQKFQILEQLLVLFNPSLELQTTDNYIDWTSLSVLELVTLAWSSRSVPVGNDSPIDIATLTLEAPIWISPPVKVKKLGVITNIITSIYQGSETSSGGYIDGLGVDTSGDNVTMGSILSQQVTTIGGGFGVLALNGQVQILNPGETTTATGEGLETRTIDKLGAPVSWIDLFDQYPGKYKAGASKIYLTQPTGSEVSGQFSISLLDPTVLDISDGIGGTWDQDTYPNNTDIASLITGYPARREFDRIVNPITFDPTGAAIGTRYLLVEDIHSYSSSQLWGALIAKANDIVEYNGTTWEILFDASQNSDTLIYQRNTYSNQAQIQYKWNGVSWVKSFEGEYKAGSWRIVL
jgi:hypothetical protein